VVLNVGAAGTFVVRAKVSRTTLRAEILRRLRFQTELMICDGRDLTALVRATTRNWNTMAKLGGILSDGNRPHAAVVDACGSRATVGWRSSEPQCSFVTWEDPTG